MTTVNIHDEWGKPAPAVTPAEHACSFTIGWRTRISGTVNGVDSETLGEALADVDTLLSDVYKTQKTIDEHIDQFENEITEAIEHIWQEDSIDSISSIDLKMRTPKGTIVATVRRAT